ncbi:hypothetical protein [Virgibacillus proomii]|jgi:hypothetical protein|uniref:hypothetical protein n=1 Tax=Virgibacillus proomii TaxID=84407 RepID=UPI0009873062|nr:hypothetical protein [Virgibacillus proomii]
MEHQFNKGMISKLENETERMLRKAISEYENTRVFFEPSQISVYDYFQFWLKEYVEVSLKYNAVENYKGVFKKHINPVFGKN